MAELPYQVASNANLQNAPKKKLPYIEDDGRSIGDSSLIIEYLKTTYGDRLDGHLSPAEKAISLAMRRMMEENLYWVMVYSRWQEPDNWEETKEAFFGSFPPLLKQVIPSIARKQAIQKLDGHGMGRHSASEIYQIGIADVTALSDFLADKPFFMGDRPTTLDATAYAFLSNILYTPIKSPLKRKVETLTNLTTYCDRVKARYYSNS
jgi:glutathione S-transferase